MIMIDAYEIDDMLDKDWPMQKKIEWIILNHYPRGRKHKLSETVDLILEEFEREKGDKE